jgi:hypothetical protein
MSAAEPLARDEGDRADLPEPLFALWVSVLGLALRDLAHGGSGFDTALDWFRLPPEWTTLGLAADALGVELEMLRKAARRALLRRFPPAEVEQLLAAPRVAGRSQVGCVQLAAP